MRAMKRMTWVGLLLGALAVGTPRVADAQYIRGPSGLPCEVVCPVLTVWGVSLLTGLASDVAIASHLEQSGTVPRGWAAVGVFSWGLHAPLSIFLLADPWWAPAPGPETVIYAAISVGSLALSIHGALHPPTSETKPAPKLGLKVPLGRPSSHLVLKPTLIRSGGGALVPGAALEFSALIL